MPDGRFQAGVGRTNRRKEEHLDICLNKDITSTEITTGLDEYAFVHRALPEIDLADVDLSTTLLGKKLAAPLLISPMVGGIDTAKKINKNLARAAQSLGLAMGVGSQRCLIEDPSTASSYAVRDVAPDILLLANLGAVQLNNGYGVGECLHAVESIGADALVLHLNPLQEALQPEGDTNFAGLLEKIGLVCRELPVPVIVKEVGWGISEEVARGLASAGVAAIDVAGAGGTSWGRIEGYRSGASSVSGAFSRWGIPTAESVIMVKRGAPGLPVIASGGIRTGLDAARAIALGAATVGLAATLLGPAGISAEAVAAVLKDVIDTLRVAMFCTGIVDIKNLQNTPLLVRQGGRR